VTPQVALVALHDKQPESAAINPESAV
jgi:hypothetical protein